MKSSYSVNRLVFGLLLVLGLSMGTMVLTSPAWGAASDWGHYLDHDYEDVTISSVTRKGDYTEVEIVLPNGTTEILTGPVEGSIYRDLKDAQRNGTTVDLDVNPNDVITAVT